MAAAVRPAGVRVDSCRAASAGRSIDQSPSSDRGRHSRSCHRALTLAASPGQFALTGGDATLVHDRSLRLLREDHLVLLWLLAEDDAPEEMLLALDEVQV
jgi:hypothetical protein